MEVRCQKNRKTKRKDHVLIEVMPEILSGCR
jgi:hypothetical protein